MRFSFNWLKRYLRTDLTIAEIADKLTALGLEAEKVEDPATVFKNFKLVQIKSAEKHPAADKLKICVVEDAAGAELSIVCGAKNARVGLKTILAMPGAVIPGSGETLKKSKIRGVASEGMMCSASELTISSDSEGIIEIDPNVDLSTSIADVLGCDGGSIDVSLTPNRGDCFSVKGIARDLAAGGAGEFIAPEKIVCQPSFKFPINIEYEDNKSLRQYAATFAFRVIRGVKNGESPQWLKTALKSAGMNGASALVDLSNFYMIDSGKPTHLYDAKKIKGDFRIRFAANGEIFQDIKGNEHKLFSDMLIAADDESPLCLLGVMGGQRIACDENTTDILIESALFNRVWITRTGTVANITSDARTRFERGVDLDSSVSGLEELTKLILENCGGEASDIFVIGERPLKGADEIELTNEIPLRKSRLDSAGGREFDWDEVKLILKKLGLKEIKSGENESTFTAPSWRSDLKIEEDLIEEVLRIKGYDGVSSKSIDIVAAGKDKLLEKKSRILGMKRTLAARGLSELITYSFTKQDYAEAFKENCELVYLTNPISVDLSAMRPSLIPTLLSSVARAVNYGQANVGFCESGNAYRAPCEQEPCVAGVRLGSVGERNWLEKDRKVDIFDAKGDAFAVLDFCGIEERSVEAINSAPSYYHPFRSGTLLLNKKTIGYFGELHPKIGRLFDIQEKIVCFEIFVDRLPLQRAKISFRCGKAFPKINRDFAFVFPSQASVGNMTNAICKLDPLITKASIFDCFDLNAAQKSVGVTVELDAVDRTLTEDEAQAVSDKIIEYVKNKGGELRGK